MKTCGSQCSCDSSSCSSCSVNIEPQDSTMPDRIPVPDDQSLHSDTELLPSREDNQYSHVVWQNLPANTLANRYPAAETHDSNSDSAIDLPKGDKCLSTLADSPVFNDTSSAGDNYVTYLQPINKSDQTEHTLTKDNFENEKICTGGDVSSLKRTSIPNALHDDASHSTAPTSISGVVPLGASSDGESIADSFSTYSIRPVNGPMRTFQPCASPINHRKTLNLLEVEPLLSNQT